VLCDVLLDPHSDQLPDHVCKTTMMRSYQEYVCAPFAPGGRAATLQLGEANALLALAGHAASAWPIPIGLVVVREAQGGFVRLLGLTRFDPTASWYRFQAPHIERPGSPRDADAKRSLARIVRRLNTWYGKLLLGHRVASVGRQTDPFNAELIAFARTLRRKGSTRTEARRQMLVFTQGQEWYRIQLSAIPNTRYERCLSSPAFKRLHDTLNKRVMRALSIAFDSAD
jgi:hypothetical protein